MLPGQVIQIMDPTPFVESAVNVTTSSGGADVEDIERYRYRVRELPESFSVADPDGAYIFWAKTANAGIIDVGVWMPPLDTELFKRFLGEFQGTGGGGSSSGSGQITDAVAEEWMNRFYALCVETGTGPGNVNIAPLMEGGELPTQDILDSVYDILSDKTKRPLTDFVHVLSPVPVEYDIILTYWIDQDDATNATAIQAAVNTAVDEYQQWQRSKLGRDIIPDELVKLVKQAGARRLVVESPVYTVLADDEVAQQRTVEVRYGGLERA